MKSTIGLGNILAFILSYQRWHSVLLAHYFMVCLDGYMFSIMAFSTGAAELFTL